jgi:Zn-dependent metalloprotease
MDVVMCAMTPVRTALVAVVTISAVALAGCSSGKKTAPLTNAGAPSTSASESAPAATPTPGPSAAARRALDEHLPDVKAANGDAFTEYSKRVDDEGGGTHVRYTRKYNGLSVYGGDVIVHTDANGAYRGVSNGLHEPLRLNTTPTIPSLMATNAARSRFTGKVTNVRAPKLMVDASTGVGRLAWETVVVGVNKDGQTPSRLHVLTDAKTGAAIGSWDEIEAILGVGHTLYSGPVPVDTTKKAGTYQLIDPSHGNGSVCDMKHKVEGACTPITDTDNLWGTGANTSAQTVAVDVAYGAATTFDYYRKVHKRNGIFNNGKGVVSRVHVGESLVNAFWDGEAGEMLYGDGEGNNRPLVSLDIAGHEMTHGVTQYSVAGGLTYSGESGGLNEATSDIFGTMVEFYANNPNDPGDYQVGEKVNINGDGTPLRYMYDPTLDGVSDGCWSATTKDVDVHYSSGVANHFFFNLAEGTGKTKYGTSPVCGSAPAVVGIGRLKAEKIYYRALDVYFTSNTSYVNTANPGNTARAYTLKAAQDLYGKCGTEYKAVRAAWTAVNVAGADAACP